MDWAKIVRLEEVLTELCKENLEVSLNSLVDLGILTDENMMRAFVGVFFFVIRLWPRQLVLLFETVRALFQEDGGTDLKSLFVEELVKRLEFPDSTENAVLDQGIKIMFHRIFEFFKVRVPDCDCQFCKLFCEADNDVWSNLMLFLSFNTDPEHELLWCLVSDDVDKLRALTCQDFDWNMVFRDPLLSFWLLPDMNLLDLAAFFGAVDCAKHLLLNGSALEQRTFGLYAVAGGSNELVRLAEEHECVFENGLSYAAKWWRMPLFDWLLETKIPASDNTQKIMEAVASGASTNNMLVVCRYPEMISEKKSRVLYSAASSGACCCVGFCLGRGNPDVTDELCAALLKCQISAARLLVESGKADVNGWIVSLFLRKESPFCSMLLGMAPKKLFSFCLSNQVLT